MSLASCIKKNKISDDIAMPIRAAAERLKSGKGLSEKDAAIQAVQNELDTLLSELTTLNEAILNAVPEFAAKNKRDAEVAEIGQILDEAGITGKERREAMKDARAGDLTVAEASKTYPKIVAVEAKIAEQKPAAVTVETETVEQKPVTPQVDIQQEQDKGKKKSDVKFSISKGENIAPETEEAMIAAYNADLPSQEEQLRDAMKNNYWPEGWEYRTETVSNLEDMYGDDRADWPEELVEALGDGNEVVTVSENGNFEYYSPEDAPSEAKFNDRVADKIGVIPPATSLDEMLDESRLDGFNGESATSEAFKVMAKAEGWNVDERGTRYFDIWKDNPDPATKEDNPTITLHVRVSDHSKTAGFSRPERANDIHINIAPSGGRGNEYHGADTFESALWTMRNASLDADGNVLVAGKEIGKFSQSKSKADNSNNFPINEANRENTDQLERTLRRHGHNFTITPVQMPDSSTAKGRSDYEAAKKIAAIFGKKVVFIRADGSFNINGVMDTSNPGDIFVDVRSKIPAHVVMGHELSHHMEIDSPEIYWEFFDAMTKLLRGHEQYRIKVGLDADITKVELTKEMIGDFMGDSFSDPSFWDLVGKENSGLISRIASVITKWLNNLILRSTIKGYGSEQFVTDAKAAKKALAEAVIKYAADTKGITTKEARAILSQEAKRGLLYSQLRNAVNGMSDKIFQGTAANLKLHLMNNLGKYGIKKDEIFLTGLSEFLTITPKVSKADVLGFLDENAVQVQDEWLAKEKIKSGYTIHGEGYGTYRVLDRNGDLVNDGFRTHADAQDWATEDWETTVGRGDTGDNVKFPTQVLPGGRDYLELLITLPKSDHRMLVEKIRAKIRNGETLSNAEADIYNKKPADGGIAGFISSHYPDHPNLIAHVRMNTRDDAQGRVGTFAEEFQSDWSIAGSKSGFKPLQEQFALLHLNEATVKETEYQFVATMPDGKEYAVGKGVVHNREGADKYFKKWFENLNKERMDREAAYQARKGMPPPAPFVTSATGKGSTAHTLLSLKKVILHAIEQGHEFVSWTTGTQQKERYSLSKQVDSVSWTEYPSAGKDHGVLVATKDGEQVIKKTIPRSELGDHIGKAVAEKLLEQENDIGGRKMLEGVSMDIGGEWADSLYGDENGLDANGKPSLMTQAVNEVARQLGIELKVESVPLYLSEESDAQFKAEPVGGDARNGYNITRFGAGIEGIFVSKEKADSRAAELNKKIAKEISKGQPGFTITPALHSKVTSAGMPIFSKTATPQSKKPALPEETKTEAARRVAQDAMLRFKVIQDAVEKGGTTISEAANVYQLENLGKATSANKLEDFRNFEVEPLIRKVAEAGFEINDLVDYLEAVHMPEANARMREIHHDKDATANGISDAEAKQVEDDFKKLPNFARFKDLAEEIREIGVETLNFRLAEGLITQERYDQYKAVYGNKWVPLRGGMPKQQGFGRGMSTNASQKRRFGHASRDEFIFENLVSDRERAIMQAEHNKLGAAVANFVLEAGNPDIGTVDLAVKQAVMKDHSFAVVYEGQIITSFNTKQEAQAFVLKTVSTKTSSLVGMGLKASDFFIEKTFDPHVAMLIKPMLAENEIQFYVKGHAVRIQLNDPLLARAATNGGIERLAGTLYMMRQFNNFLSKAYTAWSPDFLLVNPVRDIYQGSVVLTGKEGIGFAGKAMANYPLAFGQLWKAHNDSRKSEWVTRYRKAGGNTGAAYMSDIERVGQDTIAALQEFVGWQKTYQSVYDAAIQNGSSEKAATTKAIFKAGVAGGKKIPVLGHFLRVMTQLNGVFENALRLATFKAAIDAGKSDQQAAMLAKDLMNFNRKGEIANQMGAAYLFFNPSMQGAHVVLESLLESPHKNQARWLIGGLTMAAFLLAEMGRGGDEEEEREWRNIPDYIKARNLVVKMGDHQATIPVAYGFGVFHSIGNAVSDLLHGVAKSKVSLEMANSVFENFSVFGNPLVEKDGKVEFNPMQILPTIPKMLAGPSTNLNSLGGTIAPKKYKESTPDSQNMTRALRGSNYAAVADKLNSMTGGNKYQEGVIDVSPNVLKYWVTSITGGFGRFTGDMVDASMGGTRGVLPELENVPVVRKFVRESDVSDSRAAFWQIATKAKIVSSQYSAAIKNNESAIAASILADNRPYVMLNKMADTFGDLAGNKRNEVERIRNSNLSAVEKKEKIKVIEKAEQDIYDRFLLSFDSAVKTKSDADKAVEFADRSVD